jgi:hypothetical protein
MNEKPNPSTERRLSPQESAIIDVVRINQATPRLEVKRDWRWGRWNFSYRRRSSKNLWGRFGGGWNWKLGVDIGGSSVILNLLVSTLRIERVKQ